MEKMEQLDSKPPALAHILDPNKPRTRDVTLDDNATFETLLLPQKIQEGLKRAGFRKPSPIQYKAIPLGRCGFDLVVKSKSGTGKTLVFATVALEVALNSNKGAQGPFAIVLAPTREIAVQIEQVLNRLSDDEVIVHSFIGGLSLDDDVKKCRFCHIAVGAPGRIKHLVKLKAMSLDSVKLFVMDEADKLMESSFQSDINDIYNALPVRKQVMALSATYPEQLDRFLTSYMLSPTHCSSEVDTPILLGVKQFVSLVQSTSNVVQTMKAKNKRLLSLLSTVPFSQCLIFLNYQTRAESVNNFLNSNDWPSVYISAAQSQVKRLESLNNLRDFKKRILVSTDLTARGIDNPNLDLVINYDIPQNAVVYLHRMGRAGRFGSPGMCVNLVPRNGAELESLRVILGKIGGASLQVPVLPAADKGEVDGDDGGKLEFVSAVVESRDESEHIRCALGELEQSKGKNSPVKSESPAVTPPGVKTEDCSPVQTVKSDPATEDCSSGQIVKSDPEIPETSSTKSEMDCKDLLLSLSNNCPDDLKLSRKRNHEHVKKESPDEKRRNPVFCKNKALLTVTRLLCDPDVKVEKNMVESIGDFIELEENQSQTIEASIESLKLEPSETVEDIFRVAYDSALGGPDWLVRVPRGDYQNFVSHCRAEAEAEVTISDDDSTGYDDEEVEEVNDQSDDVGLLNPWVPVEAEDNARGDNYGERFGRFYQDCGSNLWQHGLAYDSVEAFDQYFVQWRENLERVRNYIQQNIYVSEMSQFQQHHHHQ